MHLKVRTTVSAKLSTVKEGFTQDLFLRLNPPFPIVRLLQFDGCQKGDKVGLELNFLVFRQKWISHIIEDGEGDKEWYFIDQGVELPFFLKSWTHRHIVRTAHEGSIIIDDIQYSTGFLLTDLLMYPLLLHQFLYRKPIYRRFF